MENENKEPEEKKEVAGEPQAENRPENDEAKNTSPESGGENKKNSPDDVQTKKIICCLSYLFGILFFLPLVMYPNDETAKYQANQTLVNHLATIVGELV